MRESKDRGSKWLIEHHGDAILRLAGVLGFSRWGAKPGEVVVPKALPDGLLEVLFPDQAKPDLFLLEVATYPDKRVEDQLERDALLVLLDRRVLPEVIVLVLQPKGEYRIPAERAHTSRLGNTKLGVGWTVVEMWSLRAQTLLDLNDAGVIPYIPMTQFDEPPEVMLEWCRQRIEEGAPPEQRNNLLAITWIMASARFESAEVLAHLLRRDAVIESPVLQELIAEGYAKQLIKVKLAGAQAHVIDALEVRFGSVPADLREQISAVQDEQRLRDLHREAILCRDLEAFRPALTA